MTTTKDAGDLCDRIERLVEEYIASTRAAAQAALNRAFAAGTTATVGPVRSTTPRPTPSRARQGARRTADELGALSERLYEAVCRTPGETMLVLAPAVGATARELNRPMLRLTHAGRVRSVGARNATRYFPMASGAQRTSP